MKKMFNTTGVCIPEMHYMVDISNKIHKIEQMVDNGFYFVINRPRQYGKTTTLYELSKKLRSKYIVIDISFEAVSDKMFESEENFCSKIFNLFADSIKITDKQSNNLIKRLGNNIKDFDELSLQITTFIEESHKDVILLIDEVDKNSNNRTFMKFLGLLRNKYLGRQMKKDITFKSVILSAVHDIKNLKLAMRDDSDARFNSPWNIAMKFDIDMSFNAIEIESMLEEYCVDKNINFDTKEISEEIYKFTSGYPYLVSNICYIMDENFNTQWTIQGVHQAVKAILFEKNTLFDDIIKNIENNEDIKNTMWELLIDGLDINYNQYSYEKELMYGLLTQNENKIKVHNKIFEELIYNYFIENAKIKKYSKNLRTVDKNQFIENNKLNMEKVLLKFQEVMYEEYRKEDETFYENQGRLIFLAFLKPIINGKGFSFVEAETRENKRMDIVVTYGTQKEVIELKIWHGTKYETNGIDQLKNYLDIQKLDKGFLLIFNFNKGKKYTSNWIEIDNKKIFEVIV